jgi:hypothetical protein
MSIVKADLIEDRVGGHPPLVTKADFVKAWLSVNQSGTQAIRDSLNITGIVDGGSGTTQVTLTNAFATIEFAIAGYTIQFTLLQTAASVRTATTFSMTAANSGGSSADAATADVHVCGDLA